jgi:putative restriction endonuclease
VARFFGTPDGVHVGQLFVDRRELHDAHVHRPLQAGISGTKAEGADSIVVSGGYINDEDFGDYILYTGHGGKDPDGPRHIADQSVSAPGNAGLITSMVEGLPVRVVRGAHGDSPFAPPAGYRYSGLYVVTSWWREISVDGYQIVRFRLDRIEGQPTLEPQSRVEPDPTFATAAVTRRIRDSVMARQLKRLYDYSCQVCDTRVPAIDGRAYAEGAHVRPLGRPHLGADTATNLLCLCPNHHAQLDVGGMVINDKLVVVETAGMTDVAELRWRKKHKLDIQNARYHRELWLPRAR